MLLIPFVWELCKVIVRPLQLGVHVIVATGFSTRFKELRYKKNPSTPSHLPTTLLPCWLFVPPGQQPQAAVKMSQREWGRRKCSVCQSTRGQCEIPAMRVRPTNSPPTWNNSHKTCCGLPISAGCFLPRDLITEGELNHSALTRDGGVTLFVGPFSRDSSLIWEESAFHLQEMCFQTQEHNKCYWQINTIKKRKEKGQIDISLSCLWCHYSVFEEAGKKRIISNELKNKDQDELFVLSSWTCCTSIPLIWDL